MNNMYFRWMEWKQRTDKITIDNKQISIRVKSSYFPSQRENHK